MLRKYLAKMCADKSESTKAVLALLLLAIIPDCIVALSNVSVTIPTAVKRGDNALLICNYNMEGDYLYSVKWYRGRREFYRYTPKENPALKTFSTSLNTNSVDTAQSNASHLFLRSPQSGKYSCEVSADAPSFDTFVVSAEMEVVELPAQRPIITGIHSRYRLGDIINGNCSSDYSKPASNLTWWINDIQVPPNYERTYPVQKHLEGNLQSAVLEINFIVTIHHFIKGRLKLKCSARIYDIYAQESEKLIEEDRPRILASGRSPEMNMFPFDQPNDGEGFNEQNELYLTHYKNAPSSAVSLHPKRAQISYLTIYLLLSTILSCVLLALPLNLTEMAQAIDRMDTARISKFVGNHCKLNSNDIHNVSSQNLAKQSTSLR